MNVLIISQCSKRAREETCRIVDQFAERAGSGAWQTAITQEGLSTLRKLLRKSARRNTAVACHLLKKSGQSELLWIVGNQRRFNAQGRVPTNRTGRPLRTTDGEGRWQCAESIALLAAIAGLFHDFGKASRAFQETLTGKAARTFQPYRHEWISLRLFQAFVGEGSDEQWLAKLGDVRPEDESALLARLRMDTPGFSDSPFRQLPPGAQAVAWLILSHHRLPENFASKSTESLDKWEFWLINQLNADWNSLNSKEIWDSGTLCGCWEFPSGTPLQSSAWREKARQIARRINNATAFRQWATMDQPFTLHMARFSLMLADHHYSAGPAQVKWQDPDYIVWANSDRKAGVLKQRVDEHLCGVAQSALLIGRQLARVRDSLPAIARHKGFRERASDPRFHWQNRAWDCAQALRDKSREEGFFGVNMASTGCGKTFANARIMYALADEQAGCRFTIALGLRTLTLQTGEALQARLGLDDDDLAVRIGSQAVSRLWKMQSRQRAESDTGSASADALDEPNQHIRYEGSPQAGVLQKWLENDPLLDASIAAPILVSTIDHLISATEGVRGGRQLPGILRLLTSDLVLDEPDDFGVEDLPALCRLVNWAGMLGSRVLLSSATLPPELIQALFAAYLAGRKVWNASCGVSAQPASICCAWFDESGAHAEQIPGGPAFKQAHLAFVAKRAAVLAKQPRLHFGRIASVEPASAARHDVFDAVAQTLHREMMTLHKAHHEVSLCGKAVSFGLVRFANINPLIAVCKRLISVPAGDDCCIHYCFYHARHPLAVRSAIESRLDSAFDRRQPGQVWQDPEVRAALDARPEKHHLFVVLGTSVIEVGRDWDADWGIVEPSSMRAIIQFAGRIQRHRRRVAGSENIVILSHNIRALCGERPAYCRPGFEDNAHPLPEHDLRELLPPEDYRTINALPRILEKSEGNALAALEHDCLQDALMKKTDPKKNQKPSAACWWRLSLTWSGYLQRRTPFRHSRPEAALFLHMADEESEPAFVYRTEAGLLKEDGPRYEDIEVARGVTAWGNVDYRQTLLALADTLALEIELVGERFAEIRLPVDDNEDSLTDWLYHPWLGVYRAL
ncbi:type I-F CRISPR-associated helicase Cas3f [Pluralibacter gergoviae]|uniref:type I-F CRISPR-associated helicase Cas3f n=1 Tax=Pluralibacter gergoviae TaxID=61647 RepID=UPI000651D026|nr:type I-F CRISPR-associated helicase Cas3f [Pluralibacter gergoviae]EKV0928388.1 type I-F CRISPR-associated helicase Cas3 [Pluralibacter gergoviae]EKV6246389.1 type I-F CRISPR-associated helicase Cas3 [Pluralibacter gergoviae]EKW9964526.1 type I-F CRISPR-associated helicase Cas3 [Pluralibacter gergoviae]ELD4269651.1 type I-F CRISPR-associated helicase Cas3 [Pluralibacter gergoviae]ELD4275855.1 type I-F CRISPR-associated helicase Cas3 [Pluralibacter gergoviae]